MYIPVDPNKIKAIWDELEKNLLSNEHSYIIYNGNKNKKKKNILESKEINNLISRMYRCDYIRIGTNKMIPFPPHFSIKL